MRPDPTTPGPQPKPTALGAAATTAIAGTPAAVLTVWLLDTYGSAHGKPLALTLETATAIGSIGAAVMGYVWRVLQAVLVKWGLIPSEP
jgi:hypothetical protein